VIRRVLVIKLAALGDFVQAFGPFATIRAAHPQAEITLLTTRPYAGLATASPWFDHVHVDDKPKIWQLAKVARLKNWLRCGRFDRVYDLQTSDRSNWYFRLMGGDVEWSGIAKGCSHPHANPRRDFMHTLDRQAEQLAMAGLSPMVAPDLGWAGADVSRFGLPRPYALICPGGAAHRPGKRWTVPGFSAVAVWLAQAGVTPVLIGAESEQAEIGAILAACPQARPLAGQTSFADILGLAVQAQLAVGNDTGPMHLIAAAGCPGLVLFGPESDPALCGPRGRIEIVTAADLGRLEAGVVMSRLAGMVA
jgi:ADP-heptose:LPS heptosyltransferase